MASKVIQTYHLGAERIADYCPGGHHPVHLGDVFHERYKVINKLGAGAYSIVWIVEDLHSGRFASLKIVRASALATSHERDVIRHLKRSQEGTYRNSPGREFVMEILDDFLLHGPNGVHLCIVTELLGPPIQQDPWVWEELFPGHIEEFPAIHAKKLCVQVARGLAYLHQCNIVHGDLNCGNMVLRIPGVERWTRRDIEKYFGQPDKQLPRDNQWNVIQSTSPNVPKYGVVPPDPDLLLNLCIESIENFNIKLCDFGEAFIWDGRPKDIKSHMPLDLAAPEVLLRAPLTPSIDVWALACVMFLFLDNCSLFPGDLRDHKLRSIVSSLGKLPDCLWTRWEERREYFDEDANSLWPGYTSPASRKTPNRKLLTIIPSNRMTQLEISGFVDLVSRMVCLEAETRITMDEVVRLLPKEWN